MGLENDWSLRQTFYSKARQLAQNITRNHGKKEKRHIYTLHFPFRGHFLLYFAFTPFSLKFSSIHTSFQFVQS